MIRIYSGSDYLQIYHDMEWKSKKTDPQMCKDITYDKGAILSQWGKAKYFINDGRTRTN